MNISIQDATDFSIKILKSYGFSQEEAELTTENFIEGELTGNKSHGLVRLPWVKKFIDLGKIKVTDEEPEIKKETPVSILLDGKGKTGFYVVNKLLELGIAKVKTSGMVALGTTNTSPTSGLVGFYARKAAEHDLISLHFNNSTGFVVPFGAKNALWGTNPVTVGMPSKDQPVILDMATSKINAGDVISAKSFGKNLEEGNTVDGDGKPCIDPNVVYDEGGILPIAGHKGSGLSFIVELLAGAVTDSKIGMSKEGGWGTFMILIDPSIFRPLEEYKQDVTNAISELKNADKMPGFDEIYYPGEQSQRKRENSLAAGSIEVEDKLRNQLREILS